MPALLIVPTKTFKDDLNEFFDDFERLDLDDSKVERFYSEANKALESAQSGRFKPVILITIGSPFLVALVAAKLSRVGNFLLAERTPRRYRVFDCP